MRSFKFILVTLAAVVAIDQCKAAKPRQQVLTLHAGITCADGDPNGAYALLFMDGLLVDSTDAGSGGFTLDLPLSGVATLEVHKPGCIAKRVVIDTDHMKGSLTISCTIMLFPQPHGEHQEYTAPVGRMHFAPGTGDVIVEHDYSLVSRPLPMREDLTAAGL